MKVRCPKCEQPIPAEAINVQTDMVVCHACDEAFVLSEVIDSGGELEISLDDPPRGTWLRQDFDGWQVGSTTRSAAAFFLIPFLCIWSGVSIGGIYGSQIAAGKFELIPSLFGIPFLLGTIGLGWVALLCMFGHTSVTVDDRGGRVFTGIGFLGHRRWFDWESIRQVKEDAASYRRNGRPVWCISLHSNNDLKFGSMLSDQRRHYMIQALRKMLSEKK